MDKKRVTIWVFTVVVISFFCLACGSDEGGGPSSSGDTTTGPDAEGGNAKGETTDNPDPSDPGYCESPLEGRVEASGFIKESTSIESYHYSIDQQAYITKLKLRGRDGRIGTLKIGQHGIGAIDAGDRPGMMRYRLERPDKDPVVVRSEAYTARWGYRSRSVVNIPEGKQFEVWGEFDRQRGFERFYLAIPTDQVDSRPSTGAVRRTKNGGYYMLELMSKGESGIDQPSDETIQTWLNQTGVESFFEPEMMKLFAPLHDNNWMEALNDHWENCETRRQSLRKRCQAQTDGECFTPGPSNAVGALGAAGAMGDALSLASKTGRVEVAIFVLSVGLAVNWAYNMDGWSRENMLKNPSGNDDCSGSDGCEGGDPHITTFDGLQYDYQGVGEFIAVKSYGNSALEVQVRHQTPAGDDLNCSGVSVISAVAVEYNGQRIMFDARSESGNIVKLNGSEVTYLADAASIPSDGWISDFGGRYVIAWPDGSNVQVTFSATSINLQIALDQSRKGQIKGLLGNYDGDWNNDLTLRDGRSVTSPVTRDQLYKQFGNSWRIRQSESLFDYQSGNSTATYTELGFPEAITEVSDLPADIAASARETCRGVGITDSDIMADCILDVGCTGDVRFAQYHRKVRKAEAHLDIVFGNKETITIPTGIRVTDPPESVLPSDKESNRWMLGFSEYRGTKLFSDIDVDHRGAAELSDSSQLEGGTISSGTNVNSYFFHFDPADSDERRVRGRVHFPYKILGVILTSSGLDQTDGRFGASGTAYPVGGASGLELGEDTLQIGENRKKLKVRVEDTDGIDQFRVLTKTGN